MNFNSLYWGNFTFATSSKCFCMLLLNASARARRSHRVNYFLVFLANSGREIQKIQSKIQRIRHGQKPCFLVNNIDTQANINT